jgi:uncharacterized protein YbaR (Trm112 family)
MLDADFLKILRCPIDPTRTAELTQPDETHLLCSRCQVRFAVRDGFPILLADEAQLPPGCPTVDSLPCHRQ